MAGWAKGAMGAVVAALVMGCSGGGGGGGSGNSPPPYELGTTSEGGAPGCDLSNWCPDGDLMEATSKTGEAGLQIACLTQSSLSQIAAGGTVSCFGASVRARLSETPDGCIPSAEAGEHLVWIARTLESTGEIAVGDRFGAPTWEVACNPGATWAHGFLHDGVIERFDADGNLTESTPL